MRALAVCGCTSVRSSRALILLHQTNTLFPTPRRTTLASQAKADAAAAKAASLLGGDKEDNWDASTRAGDDSHVREAAATADDFLRENAELKKFHSTASVRSILVKAEQKLVA